MSGIIGAPLQSVALPAHERLCDTNSSSSESESEPEPEPKPRRKRIKATASGARRKSIEDAKVHDAKRIHAAAAAKAQQDHWFEDESEAELESDF